MPGVIRAPSHLDQPSVGSVWFLPRESHQAYNAASEVQGRYPSVEGHEHPVLVLDRNLQNDTVEIMKISSLRGESLSKYRNSRYVRGFYLPISPADRHPDNNILLALAKNQKLEKRSYVNIRHVHAVPRSSLRRLRGFGTPPVLKKQSLNRVFQERAKLLNRNNRHILPGPVFAVPTAGAASTHLPSELETPANSTRPLIQAGDLLNTDDVPEDPLPIRPPSTDGTLEGQRSEDRAPTGLTRQWFMPELLPRTYRQLSRAIQRPGFMSVARGAKWLLPPLIRIIAVVGFFYLLYLGGTAFARYLEHTWQRLARFFLELAAHIRDWFASMIPPWG